MELKKYLEKYKDLKPPHESTVKILIDTINYECGILLTEKEISIRHGGVVIYCHPAVRSELLQYAPHILSELFKKHRVRLSFIR